MPRNETLMRSTQSKVIAGLIEGKTVEQACLEAGVSRRTYWNWRDRDPNFTTMLEEAELTLKQEIVDDAVQQAVADFRGSAPKVLKVWHQLLDDEKQQAHAVTLGFRHLQEFQPKQSVELSGSLEARLQELDESPSD